LGQLCSNSELALFTKKLNYNWREAQNLRCVITAFLFLR